MPNGISHHPRQETLVDPSTTSIVKSSFHWKRLFGEIHPYDAITWERRTAKITKGDGKIVFEQTDVEVPNFWTQTATDIVASKYFRGKLGSPERETSARQMIDRVADTITRWGLEDAYFASSEDAENFNLDLKWLIINQYFSFNSPVWFNIGVPGRPQQGSACQPYRALISTPNGFYKIGEIVENNLIGLPVYDSKSVTRVVAVKNNGLKKVYKVILRNGTYIEATGDHLIKVAYKRRIKPVWIRLDQLKPGMMLHLHPDQSISKSESLPTENFKFNFPTVTAGGQVVYQTVSIPSVGKKIVSSKEISEVALAGWLQADGFVGQYSTGTNKSLTIEFLAVNKEEQEWIEKNLDTVFPNVHRKLRVTKTKAGTEITRIRLYGQILKDFVTKYDLLKRRKDIRVPEVLWKSSQEVIVAYLKSFFQAEGFVSLRESAAHVKADTISSDWMHDIQILLYGLGIYSKVRTKKEKRKNRSDLFEINISVGSERVKFAQIVGFIGNSKNRKLLESLKMEGLKHVDDLKEEEIISIHELGEEVVYDIQTESGEYLTNNVTVHNCFILSVDDTMQSILEWYRDEGIIFQGGSGSGLNVSNLRASKEPLSKGGFSSGPVSFMKGADGVANTLRSGGVTRRAAKMVVMNVDHPDIRDFIYCKKVIEDMTKALAQAGIKDSIAAELFDPYTLLPYQNANNSVRVTDEFMKAVEEDKDWHLTARVTGEVLETVKARQIMDWMADAAWHSADPGVQYDTTINDWHTLSNTGRINASNPCVTGDTLVAADKGLQRISNLVGERPKIETGRGYYRAKKVWQTGIKPVYELRTRAGYSVKVTKDHKFSVIGKGDIEAINLKKGDIIPLHGSNFGSESLEEAFALAAGYAVGDGCLPHKITRGNSALTWVGDKNEDVMILERIAYAINYLSSNASHYSSLVHVHASTPGIKVVTSRPDVVLLMSKYAVLDKGSENKKFTDEVFSLDKKSISYILQGLFSADGTVSGNAEKGFYVGLDSSSLELLKQVQILLLNFGIKSKIYTDRRISLFSYLPDSQRKLKQYPVQQMHSLRVTRSSRIKFEKEIGFLAGTSKAKKLNLINKKYEAYRDKLEDDFKSLTYVGVEPVFDLTEPESHHFVANGLLVHNCSEYMSIDNSACNLASFNLIKFLKEGGRFDVDLYKQAVDTAILAQDILVDRSSYPTPKITENAKAYRQLGLGYANLGALLMILGFPYDSDEGRSIAGHITSLTSGEAYRMSNLIAGIKGPYSGFAKNREPQLRVIGKHLNAAEDLYQKSRSVGLYDGALQDASRQVWHEALELGHKNGVRNSQVTVLAPTGTISFLMDCDTTGVEPEIALVRYKKLVGGGVLKLVNNQVPLALRRLGYTNEQVEDISNYLLEKETIEGAPHLKEEQLSVFDCSFKAANGLRSISYQGHVKMMAAVQPFISGAISKTVNLPADATAEEIKNVFMEGWKLGLKAIAIYRDGCKTIQPINTSKEEKAEVKIDPLMEQMNGYTRRQLPNERPSVTHRFTVGGYKAYLNVGFYPDTMKPGETFITTAKEGSTVSGLFDTIATLISICLQSGVPLKVLVRKFIDLRFEPAGFTDNPDIPIAKSIVDYIFRYLGLKYLNDDDKIEIFGPDAVKNQLSLSLEDTAKQIVQTALSQPEQKSDTLLAGNGRDLSEPIRAVSMTEASAPVCQCGTLMVRAGACYSCPNCFATTGACN